MEQDSQTRARDSERVILDPPPFSPSPGMRAAYLEKRKSEIGPLMERARTGEWKPVMTLINHVRGTGGMYGFVKIGEAAELVVKAVQDGRADVPAILENYASVVGETSI